VEKWPQFMSLCQTKKDKWHTLSAEYKRVFIIKERKKERKKKELLNVKKEIYCLL